MKTLQKVSLVAVAAMGVMSAANADLKILTNGAPTHKIISDGGPDSLPIGLTGWVASPNNAPTLIAVDAGKYKFEYTGDGDASENNSFSVPPANCVIKNPLTNDCSFKNFPHPAPYQSFTASFPAGATIPWTFLANSPPGAGTLLTNGSTTNVDGASYFVGIDGSSALPPSATQGSAAWIGLSDRPIGIDHDYHDLGVKVSQVPEEGPCTLDSTAPNGGPALAPGAPGIVPNDCAPVLFPPEQGAFKGLEVATQLVEASILQQGCDAAEYDLNVATNNAGTGTVTLDGVKFGIKGRGPNTNGRIYDATGPIAPFDDLGVLTVSGLKATGSYNIGSGIQELTTDFTLTSSVTAESDKFRGTIIKDYVRLSGFNPIPEYFTNAGRKVSTVVDYGYQQIQKNDYVAAKYWQQSQTWRQNGVRPGTWWVKTRVAPEGDCTITVHLEGTNGKANQDNAQGFNETGTISVNVADPQGIPGVDYKN